MSFTPPRLSNTRLVYFGHNRNDVATIRRIQSLMSNGIDVTGMTFRRDGETGETSSIWKNIDLGYVEHAKLFTRLLVLLKAVIIILNNRSFIKQADILCARNLDMFLLAWLARLFVPMTKIKMVYEVLDVHESLTRDTTISTLLRWIERRILRRSNLLIVSSLGFIDNYFFPIQQYTGKYFIVENKIYDEKHELHRPILSCTEKMEKRPIRVVWAGILRCQRTLDVLKYVAKKMDDKIDIKLWGKVSEFLITDFNEQISGYENIQYCGAYIWPDELSKVYDAADLSWSQELSWSGYNSDWLIPNRVYEASYYGVLSIAINGTQTGKYVSDNNIGYLLKSAHKEDVYEILSQLKLDDINKHKIQVLKMNKNKFVVSDADITNLINAFNTL